MSTKTKKVIASVVLLAFIVGLVIMLGRSRKNEFESLSEEMFAMDTVMDMTVYSTDDTDCELNDVMKEMRDCIYRLEKELSVTNPNSDVSKLNKASGNGEWVSVSEDTRDLLDRAAEIAALTEFVDDQAHNADGERYAFDPTMHPIVKLWGFTSGNDYRVPDDDEIKKELEKVSIKNIEFGTDENQVRLLNGAEIDLGACAKGYLSDELCEIMKAHHVNGILSLGGNVQTVGTKPDDEPFVVGITDPADGTSIYAKLESTDSAVITSGNYQRFFEKDGKRYHHIMDSRTGAPADSGLASVTVIGDSGLYADAYATAFFVMGEELTKQYLEKSHPPYKVVLIRDDGSSWCSDSLELIR